MESRLESIWMSSAPSERFGPLQGDRRVDVAVIGGGITGLTAALRLAEAGRSVALLEARGIAEGVSGHTTAHLTEALDTRYFVLARNFGEDGARLAAESQRAAIEWIADTSDRLGLDAGFERVPGYLFAEDSGGAREIAREAAIASKLGLPVTEAPSPPLPFKTRAALRFEDQGQIHARRYLLGLARQLIAYGVELHDETRVLDIEDGTPCTVRTGRGTVTADEVLVATHSPVSTRFALHTRLYPYRSYVVSFEAPPDAAEALLWDTEDPYHYVRIAVVHDRPLLVVGGEDHKVGKEQDTWAPFARLEQWTRERFRAGRVVSRWSAQVFETPDGLPFVGRSPRRRHLSVATGFAGNGMTHGTMAGLLLSDQVLDVPNRWTELYSPSRKKPLSSAREFLAENLDVARAFTKDRLESPSDAKTLAEVPYGGGRILDAGGRKLAVHRDEEGLVHALSSVCTHLACHVRWNGAERSWDCPCHGSRFEAASGEVICGPATRALTHEPIPGEALEAEQQRLADEEATNARRRADGTPQSGAAAVTESHDARDE